jgi:hypothetical protein
MTIQRWSMIASNDGAFQKVHSKETRRCYLEGTLGAGVPVPSEDRLCKRSQLSASAVSVWSFQTRGGIIIDNIP